ncbi:hypothetical protein AB0756_39915 [Tolypothrix campylonemoides VB511288_2]|uniref:C2H2-type domain-containing protein n=2 Tax=Nostocales TaxID=1161 RepID=A0ABW8X195_9CYAN
MTQKITCPNPDCNYHFQESSQIIRHGKDRHGNQRWLCKHCNRTFVHIPDVPPPSWQRKKARKGLKSKRGQPEIYDEVKTKQTLSLTPTAVQGLDKIAESLDISRSELVERIGRGIISLTVDAKIQDNCPET